MILYKYVTLDRFEKFVNLPTLRFTPPLELNDPFELSCSYYESKSLDYNHSINDENHRALKNSYGVLSLSKLPLIPLMWAHYATGKKRESVKSIDLAPNNTSHAGMVIGIDSSLAGLESESDNFLPSQYGDVVYLEEKQKGVYNHSENHVLIDGINIGFQKEYLPALQRIFLIKSVDWAYEKEVRVIRNIHRGAFPKMQNRDILTINTNSIKEIYIGSLQPSESNIYFYHLIKDSFPDCNIFKCNIAKDSWKITPTLLP